jgi:thymidine phosphorylase
MKTPEAAGELAEACLRLSQGWGRRVCAAVTDMSQPLGDAIGNALDIVEAVELLRGDVHGRLRDLAVIFAARALQFAEGVAHAEAIARAERALDDGHALERFRRMIEAQGGDPHVVDDPQAILPRAAVVLPILPEPAGTLAAMEAEEIGLASGALGAGRIRKGDVIDPAVGILLRCKIGDLLVPGDPIGEVHARSDDDARVAIRRVLAALSVVDGPVTPPPLVHRWIDDTRDGAGSDEPVGAGR